MADNAAISAAVLKRFRSHSNINSDSLVSDVDESSDRSQLKDTNNSSIKKNKKKKKKKSNKNKKRVSADDIDAAIDNVIFPQSADKQIETEDSRNVTNQLNTSDAQLKNEIIYLRETVTLLQQKVDFLLSYVGITETSAPTNNSATTSVLSSSSSSSSSSSMPVQLTDPVSSAVSASALYTDIVRRKPAVLNPSLRQAVVSAVYADQDERNRKSRNIVISGLAGDNDTSDIVLAERLLKDEFCRDISILKCRRLGQPRSGRTQPLLAVLPSPTDVEFYIKNARRLRQSTKDHVRQTVYINPDLTRAEALAAYQRRCRRREVAILRRDKQNNGNIGQTLSNCQSHQFESALNASAADYIPTTCPTT